jgi:uncharacterized tellurite resistance protein B-like protein
MTREEILQEAAGNPQYKDVHEFLMAGSINSNLAMDFILQMEPTNAFALWYLFDQVRKKFMTVPGGDLSSSQNRIKKAKIYLLIAAGFVDGDLAEEEDQAIRQIANSFEFRIPDVNYKAIIQEFNLDSAFNALKEANYGERIRLIHAVDYIFKKDGSLKPEERNFMCTLFSQLGVKPSDITEFNPEEYGIRSNISQQGPPSVQQSATSASSATVQPQREAPSSPAPSAKGRSGCGWLVILGLLLIGGLVWFFFGNNRLKYDSTLEGSAAQTALTRTDTQEKEIEDELEEEIEEEVEEGRGSMPDEYEPIFIESSEAGTLGSMLSGWAPDEVTALVVSGLLDARDFNTLKSTYKYLSFIDISDVKIEAYHGDGGTDANTSDYKENELPLGAFFYWVPVDEGMPSLTAVHLPKSITAIGRNALARAYNITMIEIPEGVRTIGYVSFAICTSLQFVDLPSTLTSIGNQAFASDKNIIFVNCHAIIPPSLGNNVFECPNAELHVPEGYKDVYAESDWGKYFSYIKDDL